MKSAIAIEERWARIEPRARRFLSPEGYRIVRRWYLAPESGQQIVPEFIRRRTYPMKKGGEEK